MMGEPYKPTMLIRADANPQIGSGHVMRCIALGQAWYDQGGRVVFLSNMEQNGLYKRITNENFEFVFIPKPHPDESDLECTIKFLSDESDMRRNDKSRGVSAFIVMDGYHFDSYFQKTIIEAGYPTIVIDDMNHLPCYHADVLINQNIHASEMKYCCDSRASLLLGTKYAILRREFATLFNWQRRIPNKARKILVTFGGADYVNFAAKVLEAIKYLDDSDIEVKIIIGPLNRHIKMLEKEIEDTKFSCDLLSNVSNIAELMVWGDLAISAAGSTCWELGVLGMPSLIVTVAENQKGIGKQLDQNQMAKHLGWYEDISVTDIEEMLKELIFDPERRFRMSNNIKKLFVGNPISNILQIINFKIAGQFNVNDCIRKATFRDAYHVWKISNEPTVRLNSFNSKPITWDQHEKWFKDKMNSSRTVFWVCNIGGLIGGQVRYDKIDSETAEIHFSTLPSWRGKKLASTIIKRTIGVSCKLLNVHRVEGISLTNNIASKRTFLNLGFRKICNKNFKGKKCVVYEHYVSAA